MEAFALDLARRVLTQCGLISGFLGILLLASFVYFAKEMARIRGDLEREREGREKDRAHAMDAAAKRAEAFDALATSHSKITDALATQAAIIAEMKGILFILGNRQQ